MPNMKSRMRAADRGTYRQFRGRTHRQEYGGRDRREAQHARAVIDAQPRLTEQPQPAAKDRDRTGLPEQLAVVRKRSLAPPTRTPRGEIYKASDLRMA